MKWNFLFGKKQKTKKEQQVTESFNSANGSSEAVKKFVNSLKNNPTLFMPKTREQKIIDYVNKISSKYMVSISPYSMQFIIQSDDPVKGTASCLPRKADLSTYKDKLCKKCLELLEKFNISKNAKLYAQQLVNERISLIDEEQKEKMLIVQDSMIPEEMSFMLGTINYDSIALNPLMDIADIMNCKELEAAIYHYMGTEGYTTKEIAFKKIKEIIDCEKDSINNFQGIRTVDVLLKQYRILKMSSYIYEEDYNSKIHMNPVVPKEVEKNFCCDKCGKRFSKIVKDMEEDSVTHYKEIAKEYENLGHRASVMLYCDNCKDAENHNLSFSVTLNGSCYTHTSYPRIDYYGYYVGREYGYALRFLEGWSTVEEFDRDDVIDEIDSVLGMNKIEEIYENQFKENSINTHTENFLPNDNTIDSIAYENSLLEDLFDNLIKKISNIDTTTFEKDVYSELDLTIFSLFNVYKTSLQKRMISKSQKLWDCFEKFIFKEYEKRGLTNDIIDRFIEQRIQKYNKICQANTTLEDRNKELIFALYLFIETDIVGKPFSEIVSITNIYSQMQSIAELTTIYLDTDSTISPYLQEILSNF